jgi:hypothetical protein
MGSGPVSPDAPRLFKTGPLCPKHSKEPCRLAKAPDGPQVLILDILWLQKQGAQISMPDRGQGLTPTENVARGFIPRSTLPAQFREILFFLTLRLPS